METPEIKAHLNTFIWRDLPFNHRGLGPSTFVFRPLARFPANPDQIFILTQYRVFLHRYSASLPHASEQPPLLYPFTRARRKPSARRRYSRQISYFRPTRFNDNAKAGQTVSNRYGSMLLSTMTRTYIFLARPPALRRHRNAPLLWF